ncbi:25793_t:CDS:2 [Gigaspora margarita]|uniref:25793_t:CDS:1 n=1 Tax=Gigaspora margarita TaxID=4874 RepID=A0ABN7UXL4_GIGMA|nr:25793_t:CDS:2 [Gigaspora margarita]
MTVVFSKIITELELLGSFKPIYPQSTIQPNAQPQNNNGQPQRHQNIGRLQNAYGQLQRLQNTSAIQQHNELVNGTHPFTRIQYVENQTLQSTQFSTMLFLGSSFP